MHVVTSFFTVRRIVGAIALDAHMRPLHPHEAQLKLAEQHHHRQMEYVECFLDNARCPKVTKILTLIQDEASMNLFRSEVASNDSLTTFERAKFLPILHRLAPAQPNYGDFFRLAAQFSRGQLCMVCNSDIYLRYDFALDRVTELLADPCSTTDSSDDSAATTLPPTKGTVLALTRYECPRTMDAPLIHDYRGSHDSFIFRSPLPAEFVNSVSHPQNCYQAENIVIHELRRAGYAVLNPCRTVHTFHRHSSDVRQWLPPISAEGERYGKAEPSV